MAFFPSIPFALFSTPLPSPPFPSPSLPFLLRVGRFPHAHFDPRGLEQSAAPRELQSPVDEDRQADSSSSATRGKKKKNRFRPNFYEQTIERWSSRVGSKRTKFPWEEDETGGTWMNPSSTAALSSSVPAVVEESASGVKGGAFSPGNRVVSAPWDHGGRNRKTHLHSVEETRTESRGVGFGGDEERGTEEAVGENTLERIVSSLDAGVSLSDFHYKGRVSESTLEQSISSSNAGIPLSDAKNKGNRLKHGISAGKGDGFSGESRSNSTHWKSHLVPVAKIGSLYQRDEKNVQDEKGFIFHGMKSSSEKSSSDYDGNSDDGRSSPMCSVRVPWKREADYGEKESHRQRSNTELAERTIPEPELRRLRNAALRMKERTKVGSAGVTEDLVESIKEKWKEAEVVKLRFEGAAAINMKRTHENLENRTGGIVIWRSGSSLVLYRGMSYKLSCVQSYPEYADTSNAIHHSSKDPIVHAYEKVESNDLHIFGNSNISSDSIIEGPSKELRSASDIDKVLDELGPRFKDWSGREPLPVDADLLPSVVRGYKPPFRLLPYKAKLGLRDAEMTYLRRLARTMPPHFALGRNRNYQGLAQAIVKLWEKSIIAKIAIKRGVPNTCNDRMAEEIKNLTGGVLLSRNKEYIVFYRGNDFLAPSIAEVLVEREKLVNIRQEEEDEARQRASALMVLNAKIARGPQVAGTLAETVEAKTHWASEPSDEEREKMRSDANLSKHSSLIRYMGRKLALAQEKVRKAEKALAKVQEFLEPAELPSDLETVTDEERFLFRKMGLKMRSFLSLGRREVFDGTIENMHLSWKHRELVKIIVKGKSFAQVKHIAISLEAESGGVLISLDKTTDGYAIIIYRGKNYQRPHALRPKNLLTKRQALARSIELQRREALKHHISNLQEKIETMKSELEQMKTSTISDRDSSTPLNNVFSSDDDDVKEEGEEAYLETYQWDDEDDNNDSDDGEHLDPS